MMIIKIAAKAIKNMLMIIIILRILTFFVNQTRLISHFFQNILLIKILQMLIVLNVIKFIGKN
jgi:hypothetical protein